MTWQVCAYCDAPTDHDRICDDCRHTAYNAKPKQVKTGADNGGQTKQGHQAGRATQHNEAEASP